MKVTTIAAVFATCGLLLGPAIGSAQERTEPGRQPAAQPRVESQPREGVEAQVKTHMRSSELIGLEVRNNAEEQIGDVNDLLIDLKTGEVKHLVMGFGGFLGLGERLFAVPFDKAQFRHGEDDKFFVYNVTEEQLENAPSFERDKWPNFNDATWRSTLDRHYGAERRTERTERTETAAQPRPDVKVAGREGVTHDVMFRASTLKDLSIHNERGQDLGTVSDLIVNMKDGKVDFATFQHGATLGVGGKTVAVPFDRLMIKHTEDDRHLVLHGVTEEQLRAREAEFKRENLDDPNWIVIIERHYGPARTAERPADQPQQEEIRREEPRRQ